MQLTKMTNLEFSNLLASNAPAPGGGSASALAGSLGAALAHMVAALTQGKEKYVQHSALIEKTLETTQELRIALLACVDRDTETFGKMEAVFKMPRETAGEKLQRKEAMEKALKACSVVPLEIMELCCEALEIVGKCLGKTNESAASDLGVAALMLKAGLQGAWLNVLININGIRDERFVEEFKDKGSALIEKALPVADRIYGEIAASISKHM